LRSAAECGCGPTDDFDAREAIAALNREVARLTEMMGASSGAGASGPTTRGLAVGENGASDDSGAAPAVAPPTAPDAETRIEAFASHAPSSMQDALRSFARKIVTQADVARGVAQAAAPTELKRIVGGDTVPPGGFSSCCCIGDATDWFCTGVLVAPQVVLTAAHCGRQITRVMVGGNQVKPFLSSDAIIVPVRQVIVHPDYRRSPLDQNDINVLILAKPAGVPPVAIASPDQLRKAQDVQLVGFGYNDPERPIGFGTKRQVNAPIGAIKLKDEDLSDLERFLGFHADYEFVAGRKALGRDTCNGDSGGPAYIPTSNAFVVAGLTSRATREATVNCGDGGIYVRPDRFRDWIASVVAGAGLGPLP
jgi:endonuclease G